MFIIRRKFYGEIKSNQREEEEEKKKNEPDLRLCSSRLRSYRVEIRICINTPPSIDICKIFFFSVVYAVYVITRESLISRKGKGEGKERREK